MSIQGLQFDSVIGYKHFTSTQMARSKADILHFAGHATAAENSPWLYSVDKHGVPNIISREQISSMDLPFSLVVLSACETGIGEFNAGEGVNSLAYSFMTAGVNSLVFSLWEVNDKSTAELMKFFYRNLKNGSHPSQALRNAKINFINSTPPETRSPYYWAGFVCTTVDRSPLETNYSQLIRDRLSYLLTIGGVIGILFLILFFRHRYLWKNY